MSLLLTITIALLITFIGARIATYFKYPPIIGQFGASLLLALPFIKSSIFNPESTNAVKAFAELAIVFLMLLSGLETNIEKINECKRKSVLVALFGSITPLAFGLLLGKWIGLDWLSSFVLGTTLSITAEGTNVAILLQLKKIKTKVGTILISAGMLDDLFGIVYLSVVLIFAHQGQLSSLALFPIKIALFTMAVWATSKILPLIIRYFEKQKVEVATFNTVIITALILAILSEITGLSSIIGAFIAGLILQKSFILKRDEKREEHEIETFLFGFIIPFFFLDIALNFDYISIMENPLLSLKVIIIAIAGKMIGVSLVKFFEPLRWEQLYIIGIGMNSRGVVELVLANIALNANLISHDIYSAIVLMAVVTTFFTPLLIKGAIKKHPKVMA